ncbi:GTPase HflX [Philodulcilactobacillus myokoensis]|uniref:GTPase HflX n=1 Tax=Philodulcilactobacillus myokoensis TaxID=2929573 RepID=A0A9W6B164_9LACO|nr:GTPase HflX [Philodulcilactobacillus myokoensis]GLB46575.1 GTPase HflX [Philodulcilactobacillus myokoensis]
MEIESNTKQQVIVIGLNLKNNPRFNYSMEELTNLVTANNMEVVRTLVQKLDHPDAGTYFGKGKVTELGQLAHAYQINTIVANDELSPSQIRNLSKATGANVIDRTALILEIFANRARTREAKLQIQLAKLQYQLPRLHTSASQRLDQQTGTSSGGGFTNRGAGETQLELDRRTIGRKINNIRHDLKTVAKSDQTKRARRNETNLPNVALVGYTNAGKSTIMNQLVQRFGEHEKQVMVKNMLFATLDTKVRHLQFSDNKAMLLSDTIGFVSKLPHQLIQAFKSTLHEAANADLLIQVVDFSDPHRQLMMDTTKKVLEEIGITNIPMINVFNKADLTSERYPSFEDSNSLIMSANDSHSIDTLVDLIRRKIFKNYITKTLLVPFNQSSVVAYLNEHANVIQTNYLANGTKIKVEAPKEEMGRFQKFDIK